MKQDTLSPYWQPFALRPTWGYVSVQEAAQILHISPQSVHNWVGRGKLPPLVKKPCIRGNKRFFHIATLRAFLENRSEEDIHWEWTHRVFPTDNITSLEQAYFLVKNCHEILGVEKP